MKKVLILGSGALKIGQAGEFDYSGSQAIKALKEEGVKTVLINPNIATIQTSKFFADEVYFLPINEHFAEQVIKKEKPDGILLAFGGQTALNCGINLYKKNILKKYKVKILGTPIKAIILTEDRQKFATYLKKINLPVAESAAAENIEAAKKIAKKINYPVMIRAGYTLGGQKSGVAKNETELEQIAGNALVFSPQVLIEKYLHHYKEVEYEVVRDKYDNCVTVCNMENMDPLGIHTGDSIVVAPSQTLNNFEYHTLRKISIEIVRSLGIVGECNVQFALNPQPKNSLIEYYVIEVNARLSRSSALASKATGYPLAYIAAKLALGKSLTEIKNQTTKVTQACFEPALDYVVVKVPRWDLEKFKGVEERIGSSMKSVGEVMAIGRSFEEAIQKAFRMLDINAEGVTENNFPKGKMNLVTKYLKIPTPKRVFAIAEGLKRKITVAKISQMTGIDPWFINRIKNIVEAESSLVNLNKKNLLRLKQLGLSDRRIGELFNREELWVRRKRKKLGVKPAIFQIDTLAGEVPARTNYLYMTYGGFHDDVEPLGKLGTIVLGSGPYRIGSSVEFDWTCVNTALYLKKYGKKSILINCNPETVSTDYDVSDRLYFEELTFERVMDIFEFEKSFGTIVSVGGQTPNNLARKLTANNCKILGTKAEDIDRAEDRNKFSDLLDTLGILQPAWNKFKTVSEAGKFADKVGYPVLIRPSYVLSGSAMNVCYNRAELIHFVRKAAVVNREHPVIVSKFIEDAKEIELDAVAQKGDIKAYVIAEHVENAGVHSGDASIVYPPQNVYIRTEKKLIEISRELARALKITGPFNIQFIAKKNDVHVIEVNLRASRTLPFISKVTGVNFAEVLVAAFFGRAQKINIDYPSYAAVKVPQFSFSRLEGADPVLRVEMSSTGEAASFGETVEEAFLKAELAVEAKIPKKGIFLSLGGLEHKVKFLDSALKLVKLDYPIYATENTARFLKANGIKTKRLYKIHENKVPNVLNFFQIGKIDLAINIVDHYLRKAIDDDYVIRRAATDYNINLITNAKKAELFIKALSENTQNQLQIKSWSEYV